MKGSKENNNEKGAREFPQVDLNAFADTEKFDLQIRSRGKEDPDDAILRRLKEKWLFLVTLFLIPMVLIGLSLFVVFFNNSPHVGMAINSGVGLLMGLLGFYARGKNN